MRQIDTLSLNLKSKCPVCDNRAGLPSSTIVLHPSSLSPMSFPPMFSTLSFFSPPLLFLLCLGNEKNRINGSPLCAGRGVEWKSIGYLKTRGLRNNTEEDEEEEEEEGRMKRKKGGSRCLLCFCGCRALQLKKTTTFLLNLYLTSKNTTLQMHTGICE